MKISKEWLEEKSACQEGIDCFLAQEKSDGLDVLHALISNNKLDWANWMICRIFDKNQKVQYAIFAAEQVIKNFEKLYPDDKRPREAIEAAKKCLSSSNDRAAYSAASSAARAADSAAYSAAYSASRAADSAMKLKILNFGITLLEEAK